MKKCLQCNKPHNNKKFCCKECFNKWLIGKPHGHKTSNGGGWNFKLSEETKQKMSLAKIGSIGNFTGKTHKKEARERIRQANIGKEVSVETREKLRLIGLKRIENGQHNSYIDGRSNDKQYRSWIKNSRNRKKRDAEGSHTFEEWEDVKKKFGYMCLCCKRFEPEIQLSEDHIIPLSKGGTDYIENIQPLCRSCNCIKNASIIDYSQYYLSNEKAEHINL